MTKMWHQNYFHFRADDVTDIPDCGMQHIVQLNNSVLMQPLLEQKTVKKRNNI
jgi:hypothetical protein